MFLRRRAAAAEAMEERPAKPRSPGMHGKLGRRRLAEAGGPRCCGGWKRHLQHVNGGQKDRVHSSIIGPTRTFPLPLTQAATLHELLKIEVCQAH